MSEAPGPTELATTQLLPLPGRRRQRGSGGGSSSYATGRALLHGAASCKRTMPRRSLRRDAAQAGRWAGPGTGSIPAARPRQPSARCSCGRVVRQRGRRILPAGGCCGCVADRRRPLVLARSHQHWDDELAGELDEEFPGRLRARPSEVCARVRGRVQPHTWEAFTRTFLQGQEVRRGGQRARPDALGRVQGPRSGPPPAGRGRAGRVGPLRWKRYLAMSTHVLRQCWSREPPHAVTRTGVRVPCATWRLICCLKCLNKVPARRYHASARGPG